ncbi:MAG TPA: type IV pilus secretin PilQ [Vicinamibacterales bacterium]|nr:type IV pilus secretin PilQ [Vicinamibacterales bacterium]
MAFHVRLQPARRLIAACAVAAALCGGLVLTAAPAPVRLVGVTAQTHGRSAALLIEASQPVAYAVSRPDPLTLLVDLHGVSVADAASDIARRGPIAGVTLEQATALDGQALARVRVALAAPTLYQVHSARNTIRVDLEPSSTPAVPDIAPTPVRAPSPQPEPGAPAVSVPAATVLEHVHAKRSSSATTVTLSGNGRLEPATLNEAGDLPRRIVIDFPGLGSHAPSQTRVNTALVKTVDVSVEKRDPLLTRVVMEIAPGATYHIERAGSDGRDLAVVFQTGGGEVLVAPPVHDDDEAPEPDITVEQAMKNAAALMPPAGSDDPIAALGLQAKQPAKTVVAPPPSANAQSKPTATPPSSAKPETLANVQKTAAAEPAPAAQKTPSPTLNQGVPGTGDKKYSGHPISMDFQDADLRSVLRTFAEISGLNMVIDPQVQGRVDIVLNEVPWDQALDTILRGNKLGWTVDGTIVRIAPLAVLADEQTAQRKLSDERALAGELHVQTFPLSYAKAEALSPLLTRSALSQRGQIQVDTRTNTLIISDLPDRLQTAANLIGTLDKPEPQVEVEARIVQTTRDFARAIGVQWGFNGRMTPALGNTTPLAFPNSIGVGGAVGGSQAPIDVGATPNQSTATAVNLAAAAASSGVGLALGSVNGAFNLDVALTALENTGKGRVLSTPRLTTQNNVEAEVAQGIQIPIQTVANNTVTVAFKDAVLSLKVLPHITAANTVIMSITVQNATPDFSRQVNGIPPIDTQSANTTVQVNDGATTVIGGIFVSQQQSTDDHTPLLHRVPLLGWLFKRETQTDSSRELLIFITPRILRS